MDFNGNLKVLRSVPCNHGKFTNSWCTVPGFETFLFAVLVDGLHGCKMFKANIIIHASYQCTLCTVCTIQMCGKIFF